VHRIRKPASTESAPLSRSSLLFEERLQTFAVLSGVGKEKGYEETRGKNKQARSAPLFGADECGFLFRLLGARNACAADSHHHFRVLAPLRSAQISPTSRDARSAKETQKSKKCLPNIGAHLTDLLVLVHHRVVDGRHIALSPPRLLSEKQICVEFFTLSLSLLEGAKGSKKTKNDRETLLSSLSKRKKKKKKKKKKSEKRRRRRREIYQPLLAVHMRARANKQTNKQTNLSLISKNLHLCCAQKSSSSISFEFPYRRNRFRRRTRWLPSTFERETLSARRARLYFSPTSFLGPRWVRARRRRPRRRSAETNPRWVRRQIGVNGRNKRDVVLRHG